MQEPDPDQPAEVSSETTQELLNRIRDLLVDIQALSEVERQINWSQVADLHNINRRLATLIGFLSNRDN
jgi:hypothetical protein